MSSKIVKGPHISFKEDTRGLGEILFECGSKYGNKLCQIEAKTGKEETFTSVKARATRVAIHMRNMGINSGDTIMCCMKSSIDTVIPIIASLFLDVKIASLDTSFSLVDCVHCISLIKPKLMFVDEDVESLIENSLKEAELDVKIIISGQSSKYKNFLEMLTPHTEEKHFKPSIVKSCNETAFFYFSSGTTDRPKAICLTHFGLCNGPRVFRNSIYNGHIRKTNILLQFSSMYWGTSIMLFLAAFMAGDSRIFLPRFDAESVLKCIEEYKVTYFMIPPSYTYSLTNLENFKSYNVDSLPYIVIAGAPLHPNQLITMKHFFKNSAIIILYGSTEASGVITASIVDTVDDMPPKRLESIGKCVEGITVKVVDIITREPLGPNVKGELCVKTPYAMKGYYNTDSSGAFDEDGFIKTGDVGYYDDDGWFYLLDRIKEMFKYRSWQVVPSPIETILEAHPAVEEAVVFGIPHEIDEFHPAACVKIKKDVVSSVDDIETFVSERVADFQKLRGGIKIVNAISKTTNGKKLRREMVDVFLNK